MSISNSDSRATVPGEGSVWDVWEHHARQKRSSTAIVHWTAAEGPHRWSWESLIGRAEEFASQLINRGVQYGDVCAMILRHHPDFYPLYMGVIRAGGIPAVLAYPNPRLHPEKFRQGLQGMASRSGLDWLLTEADLVPALVPAFKETRVKLLVPLDWPRDSSQPDKVFSPRRSEPESPCLLQHSSGTTGLQKAVVLSHRTVIEHVNAYGSFLGISASDCVVSWLPLYHDMGLIAAFHLPLALGVPTVQIDPFEWVVAPALLLHAIASEGGTLTWLPNFAYHLLADRVHDDELEGIDLGGMRMFINCSEPVRAEAHSRFWERYREKGLRRDSLSSCYAMAEATFAVTQTPPGQAARTLKLSSTALSRGRVIPAGEGEATRECVSSGVAIPHCDLRVVDDNGADVQQGTVGEIVLRSPYLFSGYRNNSEATAAVIRDGTYYTGDYGFVDNAEYFVIGRKKDLIIVAGNNLYPEDIESAVAAIDGVLPGRVVAFGVFDKATGTEQVWIVAETEIEDDGRDSLRSAVVQAGMTIDVTIANVVFVPRRWLIKSSAGKPSRSANRDRVLKEFHSEGVT